MIPFLNIRLSTAAVVFAATLGTSAALTRLQAMFPQILPLTGGQEMGFFDQVGRFFSNLFG